ncbi:MAG: hypothetical protein BWY10_01522 [Chloroflexi bacterium ADurb.Bin180]|nr:MAG: hypothetical protein BWY10_01522 [Chloroflexi bacterium ADurb.Bin180]
MDTTTHITASGGLLTASFLENIRQLNTCQRGTEPESFALPWSAAPAGPAAVEGAIAAAWELLCERWDAVHTALPLFDLPQLRSRWLVPLFQLLDFDPQYQRADLVLGDSEQLRFPLTYRGWPAARGPGAPILHTVAPAQDLDTRSGVGRGVKARSPHDVVQSFLNATPADHWALLSNGLSLRLLRDYHHTFVKGYVQFDLESIFESRNYADFRVLYRLCHASRFVAREAAAEADDAAPGRLTPLDCFYADAQSAGVRVGDDLRNQVRDAIETLANGFLRADGSGELTRQLLSSPDLCRQFWDEVLHIIYRLLFLLFAEQRGMVPRAGAPLEELYRSQYSLTALRALAEGEIPREEDYADLWAGLLVTFRLVSEGAPELGVFAYDGMLFDPALAPSTAAATVPPPLLEGRVVGNSALLEAVRALTLVQRGGVRQRISYADLGVEELGSIYESLLDYTPRVTSSAENVDGRDVAAGSFVLDPRGASRKTTGSYYTHSSLVNELIKSALLPVARARLAAAGLPVSDESRIGETTSGLLTDYAGLSAEQRRAGEAALLDLRVCDPAAGSGHFLVRANQVLGAELARLRSGDDYPTEAALQMARRDVLARCIYAVDLNPMAVELCKVSLWIDASVPDQPLSFLDHHIKCGNSLLGATPALLKGGIPDEAFDAGLTGNDPPTARALRKRNREERGGQLSFAPVAVLESQADLEHWRALSGRAEDEPRAASAEYQRWLGGQRYRKSKLEADLWTAAFFWPLAPGRWVPTQGEWEQVCARGEKALPPAGRATLDELVRRHRFFHWHLEFPDVFPAGEPGGGGFDVVLGNPPWEMMMLVEKEFFGPRAPEVAEAGTGAERKKAIQNLARSAPDLHAAYLCALRKADSETHYLQHSDRFRLSSGGRVNTYAVFADLARQLLSVDGRAGIIVPSGIATDYTYREFFADLVESEQLVSFYDFDNRGKLFADVVSAMKFSLVTLSSRPVPSASFAFFLSRTDDLADPEWRMTLTQEDLALFNPNTRTCPIFRTRRDAELTRKLYRAAPVLVNERTGENPWGITFRQGLFNMTSDSHLFRTREQLERQGYELKGNRFVRGKEVYLPLYEAKMMHQYDHRWATYQGPGVSVRDSDLVERSDPTLAPLPRYWVARAETDSKLGGEQKYLLAFRDIARSTDERTSIFCMLPRAAVGHKAPLVFAESEAAVGTACILANLNAISFDYAVRQKMGGTDLTFFILRQLPTFPPTVYLPRLRSTIVPKVLELSYTGWDLQPFALDVLAEVGRETWQRWFAGVPVHTTPPPEGQPAFPPPFVWDEERRAHLRAELDAIYAHLYGLTREELEYILETFPIVRRKDEARYGEYRTKRLVLEAFDRLKGSDWSKEAAA